MFFMYLFMPSSIFFLKKPFLTDGDIISVNKVEEFSSDAFVEVTTDMTLVLLLTILLLADETAEITTI